MKFLKKLIKKPKIFQRTTGLLIEQFDKLIKQCKAAWEKAELERKSERRRERKIGGGAKYKLELLEEKVLAVLIYYKTYMTQELLGLLVGLDQSNVSRLFTKISLILEQTADTELAAYLKAAKEEFDQQRPEERINNWDSFIKRHPHLREVATDATEQPCYRSKKYEIQKKHYSGKKKQHTLKTQISVSALGRILDVSATYPGSTHDKSIIDQEKTIKKFPEKTCHRLDSGYQGTRADNPKHYLVLPIKKKAKTELSQLAKELNRAHSKRRVIVENVFSRIKKFKICQNVFRSPIASFNQVFRNVAALINFKLSHPAILM